jgi:transcriptional regulator with XRE-family HTH domain
LKVNEDMWRRPEVNMDLSNKRCGGCGAKAYARKNVRGWRDSPWKDFPGYLLTVDLVLWTCGECGETASVSGDPERTDEAVEASIRDQASQFLDIIKSKSGLSFEEIARRLGVAPSWLSSIRSKKATSSFQLWNVLKVVAIDPKLMTERMRPDYDILAENLLLRDTAALPQKTSKDGNLLSQAKIKGCL